MPSPAPCRQRSRGTDGLPRSQIEPGRDLRVAGLASIQGSAVLQECRTGRSVDRTVDAATSEERGVGGVYDRIDVLGGDVPL